MLEHYLFNTWHPPTVDSCFLQALKVVNEALERRPLPFRQFAIEDKFTAVLVYALDLNMCHFYRSSVRKLRERPRN